MSTLPTESSPNTCPMDPGPQHQTHVSPSATASLPQLWSTPLPPAGGEATQYMAQSPGLRIPLPPTSQTGNLHAHSPPTQEDNPHAIGPTPLRVSLSLPDFLCNTRHHGGDSRSDGEEAYSDSSASRPSMPVMLDDTDIGLDKSSPIQVTQARCRASRFLNVRRVLANQVATSPHHILTLLEVKTHVRKLYKLNRHKHHGRFSTPGPESSRRSRAVLRTSALTPDQRTVISPMEYHVLKDIVFYKTSGNRGNSLARIEIMMEQEFVVTTVDKPELHQLMSNDQFLYPTVNRDPSQYFCVGALGAALEIVFFKSAKIIGLAFMEDLCKPDDAEKCAHWHRKLRDRTAHRGVPPGAIAFAATQMYWALEKMYLGTNIHFDEQRFRAVWDRYFRALIKLPHLGQLRVDLLARLKEYYINRWPAEEWDDDDDSFPAW
ncbi:hypothetical protein FRC10_000494 [Ceratobasidium sp. 414]|nr:hypothetical protein FRC10_000494 [Ceratobasidium sp. 414]